MKILIVTQYFWPEDFKINDLVLGLKERNNEVIILTGKPNYPEGRYYAGYNFFNRRTEYYCGCKVVRSPLITRGDSKGFRLLINYFSFMFFGSLTALFRVRKDCDIIFVFGLSPITLGIPAIVYKLFSKATLFYWVQDLWPESLSATNSIKSTHVLSLVELIVRFIYKRSDVILISSNSFRKSISQKQVNEDKIRYLPNWSEDLYLVKVDKKRNISDMFPKNGFNIVFAGNVGEAQDFESIINAAKLTSHIIDLHWIIVGDGRKRIWAENEIKALGLRNIRMLGRFPLSEMPFFFMEADVLLVALKNEPIFSLTVPAKIQSYLAFSKPVLGMLNGEGADIINNSGAGYAVDAGDFKKLAEKAIDMYNMSRENLNAMALSGKIYYEKNFCRKTLIDKLVWQFSNQI